MIFLIILSDSYPKGHNILYFWCDGIKMSKYFFKEIEPKQLFWLHLLVVSISSDEIDHQINIQHS